MVMILIIVTVVIDATEKMEDFRKHKLSLNAIVFDYFFNFIPFIVNLLTPICVFLAVIFFTSKLANDTEIVALLSAGVSLYRLYMPYFFTSIVISVLTFYLNAYIVPKATAKRMDFEYKYLKLQMTYGERDIHKKIAQNQYFYCSSYNQYEKTAYQFSLEKIVNNQLESKLFATRAVYIDSIKKWRLDNVTIRDFLVNTPKNERILPNFVPEKITQITQLDTSLLLTPDDIYRKEYFAYMMTLDELDEYIALETMRNSDFLPELLINRMERFAFPFAAFILTLIGFSLSSTKKRGGIAMQLGIGIVLAFIFIVMVQLSKSIEIPGIPLGISLWIPNILFFFIGIYLLWKAPK
jgi:lipopolysaccharide export system permease protein